MEHNIYIYLFLWYTSDNLIILHHFYYTFYIYIIHHQTHPSILRRLLAFQVRRWQEGKAVVMQGNKVMGPGPIPGMVLWLEIHFGYIVLI